MTLDLVQSLPSHVRATSGRPVEDSTLTEMWQGLSAAIVDQIADSWAVTTECHAKGRQERYFSTESLVGRALFNNLSSLGLVEQACEALAVYGFDLGQIPEEESDVALGNGGLGRFAACFLDPFATLDLSVRGCGILYHHDLFKQFSDSGFQAEHPDPWVEEGYPFVIHREEHARTVSYADLTVRTVPYDIAITGYGTKNVGILRLWKAEPIEELDYDAFNSQRFADAITDRERIIDISRALCPNDTTFEDKVLRVRQQHFFCSTSLQEIVANYVCHHSTDLNGFAEFNVVQLNDTHSVPAIPELMRILMDRHDLGWEEARKVVFKTFVYTNRTVLVEALETWDIHIFDRLFPRITETVHEIDRRFHIDMVKRGLGQAAIGYMILVADNTVRMAWIACYGFYFINSVAAFHTEIIKCDTLKEWYAIWPEHFNNRTNGMTPRRWSKQYNPRLTTLPGEVTGFDTWVRDLTELSKFAEVDTDEVLERLDEIKHASGVNFAARVKEREGAEINPGTVFGVQIKCLHEYKRQSFNALCALDLYFRMEDDPTLDTPNRVLTLGAEVAPGYIRAKAIIKLINAIVELVDNDMGINGCIKVVFVHNYNILSAGHIIPTADVSGQTSTAGKEVSGTPNVKFMMNGALVLGVLDGTNVETLEAVDDGNAYTFGATDDGLPELRRHYDPHWHYEGVPGLKHVINAPTNGTLNDSSSGWFHGTRHSVLEDNCDPADVYYVLGDFASYRETKDCMAADYRSQKAWNARVQANISHSGCFFSDRMILNYAHEVWRIEGEPIA